MNRIKWIFSTLAAFVFAATAQAQVPSLINYQGRLTDVTTGEPFNGTVSIGIKIVDSVTEGKIYYTEDVGVVGVSNGVYSFNYGAGKSLAESTEVMGVGDGDEKVFSYNVSNVPIIIGNVSVFDGGTTWKSDGTSPQNEILGTVDAASGNVRAIFLLEAPYKGQELFVTYEHYEDGLFGSLLRIPEPWMELSINGKPLVPRQRLVTVPYASISQYSVRNETAEKNSRTLERIYEKFLSDDQPFRIYDGTDLNWQRNLNLGAEDITNLNFTADYRDIIKEHTNMFYNNNGIYFFGSRVRSNHRAHLDINVVETQYVPYVIQYEGSWSRNIHYADDSIVDNVGDGPYRRYRNDNPAFFFNPFPMKEVRRVDANNNHISLFSLHHQSFRTKFPTFVKVEPTRLKIDFVGININRIFEFFYVTVKILNKPDVEPIKFTDNGQELDFDYTNVGDIHFDFQLRPHVEVNPFDINFILKSIRYTVK